MKTFMGYVILLLIAFGFVYAESFKTESKMLKIPIPIEEQSGTRLNPGDGLIIDDLNLSIDKNSSSFFKSFFTINKKHSYKIKNTNLNGDINFSFIDINISQFESFMSHASSPLNPRNDFKEDDLNISDYIDFYLKMKKNSMIEKGKK